MSHYAAPTCEWRKHAPAGTHQVGDRVTLCTAQRAWTIAAIDGDTATLTCPDKWAGDLRAHVGHLDLLESP